MLRIKRDYLEKLKDINPLDYDVIIAIIDGGQNYRVMKNTYIEYDDFDYFHISELMDYMVECNRVYSMANGRVNNVTYPTGGFV